MQAEINETAVKGLSAKGGKTAFLWDTKLAGFGVKATPGGKKVFILQYRLPGEGRRAAPKRYTIGKHAGKLNATEARGRAKRHLLEIANGIDPRLKRREAVERASGPTVADLKERFVEEYLPGKKCPPSRKTVQDYESIFRRHVIPALGTKLVADVTSADLERLHQRLRHLPYQANRVLAVLHQAFNQAERWEWRPAGSNPTLHIERYTEERRGARKEVMLTPAQMTALLEAIEKERADGDALSCAAIRFAFWTGWRISEVLRLRWENVDRATGRARLLRTKTAAEEYRMLPAESIAVLEEVEQVDDSPWVFPGRSPENHLTTVRFTWKRVREAAGLDDLDGLGALRLHDLRHNVVSWDVSRGVSLEIAGKNVGHRSREATEVYAHFAPDALKRAADARAAAMREAVEQTKVP